LCGYVLLQFSWWAFQLVQLNRQVIFQSVAEGETLPAGQLQSKVLMVLGEGGVFLVLILLGAGYILKSFKSEIQRARGQQNFLLSITHELKTPISTIKLYLQTLLKRDLDESKKKVAIDTMLHENERLNSLVSKMLLAAKMDDTTFTLTKHKVDLSSLITELVSRQNIDCVEVNVVQGVEIDIDAEAIETVLSNLIDNALKYGASKVEVALQNKSGQILLVVKDDGQGVPEGEKRKIFQRFYRVGSEETRKTKGTGLGLYIVKTLVEMQGGVISVSDNSPKGSIFVVQFNTE
jgi:two-component system, OmpR family, phosphate regulon sensor histidine kinase PhoR